MKYDDARQYIKDGDVLTFAGNWMISRAIRWWTKQEVSHTGLAIWLRFEDVHRLCVLESMEPSGIRVIPISLAFEGSDKVYWQKLDGLKVNGHQALGWALERWGGRYASWLQFLAIMSPTFRRLRHFNGKPDKIGSGLHCSELVTRALAFGGYAPKKDPALTTPGDIWEFDCLSKPVELEK